MKQLIDSLAGDVRRDPTLATVAAAVILCLLTRRAMIICVILALCILALLAEQYCMKKRRKRKLDAMIQYCTAVQDNLSLPPLDTDAEGKSGALQSEIYKVVALLREQYALEKKQKRYLSEMLSGISHQLKTPLTAISLMTELLQQPSMTDERRIACAEKIDTQITRVTWLVRNLLTLSQLEAGVLEMKRETVSLAALLEQVRESVEILAELRGVEIITETTESAVMTGDPHWLAEALTNLVKNGVEHSSADGEGYVRIRARQTPLFTEITVGDNGSGIDPADLPRIFERFYKAKNAPPQSVGIGLALARQIVALHNGRIDVESQPGKGTVFTVCFYESFDKGVHRQ